jgi:cell division septal protein FtsQ
MFGNRSDNSNNVWNIGYDSNLEDIVGSSTWLRRMDRYEKEFDNLSNEEKKSRIHKIDLGNGNYGYVYKKANGDIAVWNQPVTPSTSTNPADS